MAELLLALGVTFLAEFGDKSQIAALSFGARHRTLPVLAGFLVAAIATQGIAVLAGGALGELVPATARSVAAALLFFVFAALALRGDDHDHDTGQAAGPPHHGWLVFAVAWTVLLAEIGDKTMLATAALAAHQSLLATWIGASLGMFAAGAAAIVLGRALGDRLPRRAVRLGAAGLFALVGVGLLVEGLR